MKQLILVFIAAAFLISCGSQQTDKPTTPTTETQAKKPESRKVNSSEVFTSAELELMANGGSEAKRGGKKNQVTTQVTVVTADNPTLTNNGGGSFTIDYKGATDMVYSYFRGGDSLSTVSGNVYPLQTQSIFIADLTFTANFTRTYYQQVVIYGSKTPDANGVIGADWVVKYSNVTN